MPGIRDIEILSPLLDEFLKNEEFLFVNCLNNPENKNMEAECTYVF